VRLLLTCPHHVFMMPNIESIDLTNNEFTELPLQEFVKLPKLRKLILDGNPVEQAYIQQIRSTLCGIEVIKNEVAKP
jgi:Leucine-rich repeat (LRR) protein